jgi:hypothetical protein
MAVDNNGTQELAVDNDGQGTRPGGKQNGIRHLLEAIIIAK